MTRATAAACFNSAQGAYAAASCTRLMITPDPSNVTSLKFVPRPGRSMACFELSPIDSGIVRVGTASKCGTSLYF